MPRKNNPENTDKLLKMISEKLLEEHLAVHKERTLDREQTSKAIVSVLQEFLSHFIVIGYTFDGNNLSLSYATNQCQADALSTALNRFMAMLQSGQFQSGSLD